MGGIGWQEPLILLLVLGVFLLQVRPSVRTVGVAPALVCGGRKGLAMGGSDLLLLLGLVQSIGVPIVAIVLLVKIMGRLDDIARRLDADGRIAPSVDPPGPDRPMDTVGRG